MEEALAYIFCGFVTIFALVSSVAFINCGLNNGCVTKDELIQRNVMEWRCYYGQPDCVLEFKDSAQMVKIR